MCKEMSVSEFLVKVGRCKGLVDLIVQGFSWEAWSSCSVQEQQVQVVNITLLKDLRAAILRAMARINIRASSEKFSNDFALCKKDSV